MDTKLSIARSLRKNDNLLILADEGHFKWIDTYFDTILGDAEVKYLKDSARNKTPYVVIPKDGRIIFVQFLKTYDNENVRKEKARRAGDHILESLKHYRVKEVSVISRTEINSTLDIVEGMVLGNYQFLRYYKDSKAKKSSLTSIRINSDSAKKAEIDQLSCVLEATCFARTLVNEPLSFLTAVELANQIKKMGKDSGCKVTVFNKKKIIAEKMGGLLAVNLGSETPPTFSIMEYKPANAINKKPIVLVGKGVVYDTGGLSLKPTANSMDFMKADMGGAAAVACATYAIAKAKFPVHVITLVPATDNRPGKNAYVPGDVVKMHSGSTVEVLNTDAEGRMLLADALSYAKRYKPEFVLDFATLTGSAMSAIGTVGMVFMGTAQEEIKWKMEESGFNTYERIVEFPLWDEYGEMIKSDIADIKNIGGPTAGAITAGKFLQHFTDYPWLHFDIAGAAYLHQKDSYRGKNGTGAGVRLLFDFFKNFTNK